MVLGEDNFRFLCSNQRLLFHHKSSKKDIFSAADADISFFMHADILPKVYLHGNNLK